MYQQLEGESLLSSKLHHLYGATLEFIGRIATNGEKLKLTSLDIASLEKKISENMSSIRLLLKDLELIWEECQDDEDAMQEVGSLLSTHKMQYEGLKMAIASAQVAARQKNDQLYHQQRQQLFAGASLTSLQRQYQQQSDLVDGAKDITSGLLRTRQVLSQQLEQAAGNIELLDTGNTVLTQAKEELQNQANLFKDSRTQINRLNRQSYTSRWSIFLVFLLFFSVAGYIGYSRAPAPIKVPLHFVANKGSQGAYFVLRQAGAGLKMVWRQASKGRARVDEDESATVKEPWQATLEKVDKEVFTSEPVSDEASMPIVEQEEMSISTKSNVSIPHTSYAYIPQRTPTADPTAAFGDDASQFAIAQNASDAMDHVEVKAAAIISDRGMVDAVSDMMEKEMQSVMDQDAADDEDEVEVKAAETIISDRGMVDVVSDMMEKEMQSVMDQDAADDEDEVEVKAAETIISDRGMVDVVSDMMEKEMQSVMDQDAADDEDEERTVNLHLLKLHKKPTIPQSKDPEPDAKQHSDFDPVPGPVDNEEEVDGKSPAPVDQESESDSNQEFDQDSEKGMQDDSVPDLETDQEEGADLPGVETLLPQGWRAYDHEGRTYFYNSLTGESTYDRPAADPHDPPRALDEEPFVNDEELVKVQQASFIHNLAEEYAQKVKD